jgi:hypothetical protein
MEFQENFKSCVNKPWLAIGLLSHDHHETDDFIESMVQILKKGLWKYGLQKEHTSDWDI